MVFDNNTWLLKTRPNSSFAIFGVGHADGKRMVK